MISMARPTSSWILWRRGALTPSRRKRTLFGTGRTSVTWKKLRLLLSLYQYRTTSGTSSSSTNPSNIPPSVSKSSVPGIAMADVARFPETFSSPVTNGIAINSWIVIRSLGLVRNRLLMSSFAEKKGKLVMQNKLLTNQYQL